MNEVPFTRLYLVRHGETTWNRETRMQGSLDSPLTSLGRAQAEALGAALYESGITAVGASIASAIDDAIGIPGAVRELPVTPQRLKQLMGRK